MFYSQLPDYIDNPNITIFDRLTIRYLSFRVIAIKLRIWRVKCARMALNNQKPALRA